jgi:hypothetical protein
MYREHINRAHKALGIVSKIQDFCDEQNPPMPYERFLVAVKNPLQPTSVAILKDFCDHCKEWPSRDTWHYVAELLTKYKVEVIQ